LGGSKSYVPRPKLKQVQSEKHIHSTMKRCETT
jgi:hypothetical protein